jgi:hypothetical protein
MGRDFFFATIVSRAALGPTQLAVQWTLGAISAGVKLTISISYLELYHSYHMSSWYDEGICFL